MASLMKPEPQQRLSQYDPFHLTENMHKMFEDFFSPSSWMSPATWMSNLAQQGMTVDIAENESSYIVCADIPGVKKEDITVEVDGNCVSISAETSSTKEEKQGETIIQSERHYGKFFRSFTLEKNIDDSKVAAKYVDGVLELTLPKKNGGQSKVISVQ
jgi:HSP20 family protein